MHGFAIVARKNSSQKTAIVSVGEFYEGYKLQEINLNSVIFSKDAKEYILALESTSKMLETASGTSNLNNKEQVQEQKIKDVSKKDIDYYAKNPNEIWKDIAIGEIKRNGKIEGFKVNRINKGSRFSELGLEVGDIIIRANNVKLSSYNDAIKLYQEVDKMSVLELIIQRNNLEKEIIYEIH